MKKYLLFAILLVLPLNIKAKCDNVEKVRLNKLASNVSFTYTYNENNNDVNFDVTITNLTKDLVIYDKYTENEYKNINKEIIIKDYKPNTSVRYYIYAKDDTCISSPLNSYMINFPSYNPYYKDELCKQATDYIYCKKWINMPYKYEEFKKNVNKYIEDSKKTPIEEQEVVEIKGGILDTIGFIYVKFYYIILPLIIVVCLFGMHQLNKKNKLV